MAPVETMAPQSQDQRRSGDDPEFIDKAWAIQGEIENRASRIGRGKYGRVLRMARKPDRKEFGQQAKITGIGVMLVGAIGFIVFYIMRFVPGVSP